MFLRVFFLESNFCDILALCERNLDDSTDSGSFSVRGYLPLVRKVSTTHMHGLPIYVKEGLCFAQDLSPFTYLALLHSASYSQVSYNRGGGAGIV